MAALASAGGTAIGWAIGHSGGRRLLGRFAGRRLTRIEELFARWGAGLVVFGRFLDGFRQLTGMAAGALGMPLAPFLLWNALGAVLWTAFWGLGAWAFTRDLHGLAHLLHRARVPLLVGAAVAAVGLLVWLARGARGEPATSER
jgi:membrane protein DedA with SNARE-associated domain